MSLFKKILKTKKTTEDKPACAGRPEEKKPAVRAKEGEKAEKNVSLKKGSIYSVKKPWISEKATMLGEKNVYVFDVRPNANKKTIKEEVESRYSVHVKNVRTVKYSGKMKKFRNTKKRRLGFKKAIVTVKEGDKIDIL